MRLFCLLLLLVFALVSPGCKQSEDGPTSATEEKGMEQTEKAPELSDQEKDKLKSLGYVE